MIDKLKAEAAERIYLQLCDDSMSEWIGEVTWCEDRVHDEDIEYVRADIVEKLQDELDALKFQKDFGYERD